MFDFGLSELILIGILALIVLGPKRLPEVARTAGHWVGRLRRFVENVKRDIDREINDEDLAALKRMHQELSDTRTMLERTASDALSDVNRIGQDLSALDQTNSSSGAADDFPSLEIFDDPPAPKPSKESAAATTAKKSRSKPAGPATRAPRKSTKTQSSGARPARRPARKKHGPKEES